jgi:hypothetical protein
MVKSSVSIIAVLLSIFSIAYAETIYYDSTTPGDGTINTYTDITVTEEGSSVTGDLSTEEFVRVLPEVLDVYCDGDISHGKVQFYTEPAVAMSFEVEGNGVFFTFDPGTIQRLPSGEYFWRAISRDTNMIPEPPDGMFVIEEVCTPSADATVDTSADGTNVDTTATDTTNTDPTATDVVLYPPEGFDVLREGNITYIFVEAGASASEYLYAYHIYRRCGDPTWWSVAKLRVEQCGGYACTYQITSEYDTCEYSVSSVGVDGRESERTPAVTPPQDLTDPSSTDAITTSDGTDTTANTTDPVAKTLSEEPVIIEDYDRQVAAGKYVIFVRTENAEKVAWYMYPESSNTPTYLGKAVYNSNNDYWEYVWDTTKVPNGDYVLVPEIASLSGQVYQQVKTHVRVQNESVAQDTSKDETLIGIIEDAAKEVEQIVNEDGDVSKEDVVNTLKPYAEKVQNYVEEKGEDAVKEELLKEQERAEEELRTLLNVESSKLLNALEDEEEFERFKNKVIITAQDSIENIDEVAREFGIELSEKEKKQLEAEVLKQLEELEDVIVERKTVLRERVGDKVFEDTDKDGISNYDEVHIYKTDPFVVDTDNDGFSDGAEVMGGFNPLDPKAEAVVVYEQPRTDGFVEEDTFKVEEVSVSEVTKKPDGKEDAGKIKLQGKAPANSFVTVYIYSTPVIVTVKTDENGNWVYELDKDLEDGDHEAYVAITDNAGKIYAKSKPLPFVKEATAVTVDEAALFTGETEPSIFEEKYLYIVVLLIIAIIGWALVFTGSRQARFEVAI